MFLWKGADKCFGSHCLINWRICCLLKANGDLGIMDLRLENDALLVRWLGKLISQLDSIWSATVRAIYGSNDPYLLLDNAQTSYGLKEILKMTTLLPSVIAPDRT